VQQRIDRSSGFVVVALLVARELAIKVHHPMTHSSTERAKKLAQQGSATLASPSKTKSVDAAVDAATSPHQRSIEDFWSVHSKVCSPDDTRVQSTLAPATYT
jgi:hypothetical protein